MKTWPSVAIAKLPGIGPDPLLRDTATGNLMNPVIDKNASIYVCGITPYDSTHMGHAATYVNFDLLKRVWLDAGYSVNHVQNVTDIDDPLFERANATGKNWQGIASREIIKFADDMSALRVLPPDHYASITEEFHTIIEAVNELLQQGFAYKVEDDIYFDTAQSNALGELSHFNADEMKHIFAARGGDPSRPNKRNVLDPLLWKKVDGEDGFDSILGKGRPGWHIECVAIANEFAKLPLSVKAGGNDLIFPHHEMCRIQCQSWTEKPLANAYLYAGMVYYQGEKMSKSLGNLIFVSELVQSGVDPMAIRLTILSNHYSQEWEWASELLDAANARLAKWKKALAQNQCCESDQLLEEVRTVLANDLDTISALRLIDNWAEESLAGKGDSNTAAGLVNRLLDTLFGIAL